MSEFTLLNFQKPSHHGVNDVTKLCLCCLEQNVKFVNLTTCKHFGILENLCSISVPKVELGRLVCYRCHAKLKTIYDFKLQAEKCFNKLWSRQYTVFKWCPKLEEVLSVSKELNIEYLPEELHTNRTPIKPEQNPVTEYPEVISGCWLSDTQHSPVDGTEEMHTVTLTKIKKEHNEKEDFVKSISVSKLHKISTKTTNYQHELTVSSPDSPQDSSSLSDHDTDGVHLAKINREVKIELTELKTHEQVGGAGSKEFADTKNNLRNAAVVTEKALHQCTHCNEKFASKSSLISHNLTMHHWSKKFLTPSKQQKFYVFAGIIKEITLTHEELLSEREIQRMSESYLQRLHRCDSCIISFVQEQTLKDHNARKHQLEENSYQCDICKSVFKAPIKLEDHRKTHYTRYNCMVCQNRYNSINSIIVHCNKLHEAKDKMKFSCSQCDYTTTTLGSYRYHVGKHKHKNPCLLCRTTYASKQSLKMHMLKTHGNYKAEDRPRFQCKLCNKSYTTNYYLGVHNKLQHKPPSLPTTEDITACSYCKMCNKFFKSDQVLKSHLRFHKNHTTKNDKRFICDICKEGFLTKTQIKAHIAWKHLKTKEFTCPQCNKSYATNSGLKYHIRYVHEKERPPRNRICDYCGAGFTTDKILRSHIRRHTGERPYQCQHCPATFTQSGARYTHIKLVHTKGPRTLGD